MKALAFGLCAAASMVWMGCSDNPVDPGGPEPSPYAAALTHPDSLIHDFVAAYNRREIEPYANLLARDFVFHFLLSDAGDTPDGIWNATQDSTGTARMFHDVIVTRILLDLEWPAPEPDVLRGENVQRVIATVAWLSVDIDGGVTTLAVQGAYQAFCFIPGRESLGEDPGRLYLFDWTDLGGRSDRLATVPNSWSRIKRLFGRASRERRIGGE